LFGGLFPWAPVTSNEPSARKAWPPQNGFHPEPLSGLTVSVSEYWDWNVTTAD
jgi:hypothetical protein